MSGFRGSGGRRGSGSRRNGPAQSPANHGTDLAEARVGRHIAIGGRRRLALRCLGNALYGDDTRFNGNPRFDDDARARLGNARLGNARLGNATTTAA